MSINNSAVIEQMTMDDILEISLNNNDKTLFKKGDKIGKLTILDSKPIYKHTNDSPNRRKDCTYSRNIAHYSCACDCGKELLVRRPTLLRRLREGGAPASCGCVSKERSRRQMKEFNLSNPNIGNVNDILGIYIDDFEIKSIINTVENDAFNSLYECVCCNGHRLEKTRGYLKELVREKRKFKCVQCQIENNTIPIGSVIGSLTVAETMRKDNPKNQTDLYTYVCKCSCGKLANRTLRYLRNPTRSGCKHSCGCEEIKKSYAAVPKINGVPIRKLDETKKSALARKKEWEVTYEYITQLYHDQKRMCNWSGQRIYFDTDLDNPNLGKNTASLDRIDNKKGYIVGNLQWLHKSVNMLKGNRDHNEALNTAILIGEHQLRIQGRLNKIAF